MHSRIPEASTGVMVQTTVRLGILFPKAQTTVFTITRLMERTGITGIMYGVMKRRVPVVSLLKIRTRRSIYLLT